MSSSLLSEIALQRLYNRAVKFRTGQSRSIKIPAALLWRVAEKLEPALVILFIEAQFEAMPEDWCLKTFNCAYPPPNVAFSGKCWERYRAYVDRGERTPAWQSKESRR